MAIVEIHLPTGYVADNVDQLQSQSSAVKRIDSDEAKIVLYLDEVRIYVRFIQIFIRHKAKSSSAIWKWSYMVYLYTFIYVCYHYWCSRKKVDKRYTRHTTTIYKRNIRIKNNSVDDT